MLNKAVQLDGKNCVFGKVIKGLDYLKILELVETDEINDNPMKIIKIVDCG